MSTSGVTLTVINKEDGKLIGGGGGGGGGHNARDGADGGNLGEPGDSSSVGGLTGNELKEWGRYGEPGKIVWWSCDKMQSSYTIINESSDPNTLKGLDDDSETYIN